MTFKLEIFAPGKADLFLDCPESEIPWAAIEQLDRDEIRVVDRKDGCSGMLTPEGVVDFDVAPVRPYAFFIGRLERDFRHARDAIRTAVESEAGIPCLWIDDGRHRTNVDSIRDCTRTLIQHATFVIADLTLGVESPDRENPSRGHEIGLAIAYERPLMLSSQEPRRDPYYSIGDMQMTFWAAEDELEASVKNWIGMHRDAVARRVFNYELPAPKIARPAFTYDPKLRYIGPKTRVPFDWRKMLGLKWS